jgi:spore coat polysaccharide biosynthesis protein SpsF
VGHRITGIIQARMGSTRLPGKVLLPLGGRSVLGWVVRAVQASGALDEVIVATTTEPTDDQVVTECDRLGVSCYRGPVDDVLSRFVGALENSPDVGRTDAVMRFTADCPLQDPEIIRTAAGVFRATPGLDYLSGGMPHTLPRGMDVEIISTDALRLVDKAATGHHRVHVTSYAYTHPGEFRLLGLTFPPDSSRFRVTLDTEQDWALIQAVVAEFGDRPVPLRTLTEWLESHPEVRELNADVRQKGLEQA